MSKKNKAKFKKQIKNQVLEQMTKEKPITVQDTQNLEPTTNEKTVTDSKTVPSTPEIQNLPQIKADLKKTGIVVAILALCILALALLDQKNHLLLTFGGWLFKVLHIN